MTNTFKPFGLSSAGYLLGAKPRGASYDIPINSGNASDFGSGEPVAFSQFPVNLTSATAYPPASQTQVIWGLFQSVNYRPSQSGNPPATFPTWIGGTTTFNAQPGALNVYMDPFEIYNVQCNATLGGTTGFQLLGQNMNLGGMSNLDANGNSQVYVDVGTISSNNYLHVKFIGLAPVTPGTQTQGGNSLGDPYPIIQVVINNSIFKLGTY